MNEDSILELTYRTPNKPLRYSDVYLCWMCGKKLHEDKPVWSDKKSGKYYCSIECRKDYNERMKTRILNLG